MRRRPTITALATTILASLLLAAPAGAAKSKDVTKLFDPALRIVRAEPDFAKAVVLEAEGLPKGNDPVRRAGQLVRGQFVFDNQKTKGSDFRSVTLKHTPRGFGKPKGHESPFLEDRVIAKAPKMTLKDAVKLLREAGFHQAFFGVTLRSPLGPKTTPPLYLFTLGNARFVAVNTKNGKVAELS
jgi:hypothetical protein